MAHSPGLGEPLVEGVGVLRELLAQLVVLLLSLRLLRQLYVALSCLQEIPLFIIKHKLDEVNTRKLTCLKFCGNTDMALLVGNALTRTQYS